jgi:hypothetical protein
MAGLSMKRYASPRVFTVLATWSSGSSPHSTIHIRRREFIFTLDGAAAARSVCGAGAAANYASGRLFHRGGRSAPTRGVLTSLAEAGYIEGRNVAVETPSADGHSDRLLATSTKSSEVSRISRCNSRPSSSWRSTASAASEITLTFGR